MSQLATSDLAAKSKRPSGLNTPIDRFIISVAHRFGGRKAKEVERFIKFAFIGLLGFLIDFGALLSLQSSVLPPVDDLNQRLPVNVAIATSIGFVLAVSSNYIWNRLWTYPDSRSYSIRLQLTQFAIVSVIGWIARTVWITATYVSFGVLSTKLIAVIISNYQPGLLDEHKLGTIIAQFIGVVVVMLWNFLANRFWTFNDVE